MAAFAFVVHPLREEAASVALDTIDWLVTDGHRVVLPVEDAALVGRSDLGVSDAELVRGLDLAVSLGGDGTMLRTVALVARHEVPVLGVNLGTLGYLTDIEPDGLRPALERVLAGEHLIEERMLLDIEIDAPSGGATETAVLALNEAVLEKTAAGHTIRLDVALDGAYFTPYAADGLIVATPVQRRMPFLRVDQSSSRPIVRCCSLLYPRTCCSIEPLFLTTIPMFVSLFLVTAKRR
jgi:NAD+ kinase